MAAAFTMIAAASCVQELGNDGQLQEGAVVYKAIAEGADTKAFLGTNEAGRPQSMWEDGDVIHIHIENSTSYRFSTSLSEPSAVADFVYQGTDEFQIQAGQAVIATYPDPDWADLYHRYALVWIPSTQQSNPEKESYDKKAVPVVAYSTDKTLHFKNAAALLKCQVNQASATRIRFYGLNDEVVAGRALAAMKENGEMDYVGIPEDEWNEHSVELSDASGGALQSSRNYYISIIPNTFASGFGIELLNAEGEVVFTKEYDKSITIERNTILNLGTLGTGGQADSYDKLYVVGTYNGWTHDANLYLFDYAGEGTTYSGMVDFNAYARKDADVLNEFKFTGGSWGNNEFSQASGGSLGSEAAVISLVEGSGDNINVYQEYRFYHFTLDKSASTLTKNYAFNSIGVIGGFTLWNEDVDMNFNPDTQNFWVDLDLSEDTELKIRLDEDWGRSFGSENNSGVLDGGDNISVSAGQYRLYVNMNNPSRMTYTFDAQAYGTEENAGQWDPWADEPQPEPVSGWSLIGEFNGWNGDEMMTETEPGLWVITGFALEAGQQWKLRKDGSWNENYGGPGWEEPYNITIGETFTATYYGVNMAVSTSGVYDIYFDESKETILVLEAGSPLPDKDGTREVTLWEGEKLIDDWSPDESSYILSDGGTELLAAGAQPGDMVCFYVESFEEDWQLNIWEGHWFSLYLDVVSGVYDLDAAGGRVFLHLTQEMLDTAFTQQWWGGTFLLNGDNLRLTKVTLLTDSSSSDPDPSLNDYVDEYGINHGPGVEINGVVWAPVNCGYHAEDFKYGKLYQWGRKYGQGYINNFFQDALAPVVKEGPVSLAEGQAAENENVFFNLDINRPSYDQYPKWSIGVQSRLWNYGTEQNPVKTEYDPCPDGWRVPTSVESALLESCTYSWVNESHPEFNGIYGSIVVGASGLGETFFPAAGYIAYGDGFGLNRGGSFFYYNSNLSDLTGAAEVYMVAESYYTRNEASAFGMSVRCVSDESPLIKVESLTIDKTSLNMNQGEACTISAEVSPADANQSSALWYSDTPSVATVDENGKVTAVSVGTARIIAMAGMKSAECVVTVKESPFIGTWKGTMSGYFQQEIYQDVTFTVAADSEGGLTVSAGINPYFCINGIDDAIYRAEIEDNQLVVSSLQQVGYDDVILAGFNHADPAAATENDHIRFIMNEDGTLSQPYAFGAYTESGGGWYEVYPGGGTFTKE